MSPRTDGTFLVVHHAPSDPVTYSLLTTASPQAIGWARAFTSSVAAALGVGPELAADIKLATSEFVSEAVVTHPGAPLLIEGRLDEGKLALRISPWTGPENEGRVLSAWDVASGLFDLETSSDSVSIFVDLALSS